MVAVRGVERGQPLRSRRPAQYPMLVGEKNGLDVHILSRPCLEPLVQCTGQGCHYRLPQSGAVQNINCFVCGDGQKHRLHNSTVPTAQGRMRRQGLPPGIGYPGVRIHVSRRSLAQLAQMAHQQKAAKSQPCCVINGLSNIVGAGGPVVQRQVENFP